VIFSSLYPNFNEEETKNSEKYFNFILANFPDRSEIILLKIVKKNIKNTLIMRIYCN